MERGFRFVCATRLVERFLQITAKFPFDPTFPPEHGDAGDEGDDDGRGEHGRRERKLVKGILYDDAACFGSRAGWTVEYQRDLVRYDGCVRRDGGEESEEQKNDRASRDPGERGGVR